MIWQSGLLGVTEEYFEARDRRLVEGRLFDNYDIETMAKVVMLGATCRRRGTNWSAPPRSPWGHSQRSLTRADLQV